MSWCIRELFVTFVLGLAIVLLAGSAGAAERERPFRIGVLSQSWGPTPDVVGLRDGLLALGYREDEDFVLGVRFTQGDRDALPAAAQQLIQHGVDILYTHNGNTARAAQQATTRIPMVFANVEDPVGAGLVQSFARPGGNITGVSGLDLELAPKRLQIFQELIPHLKRVLFLFKRAPSRWRAASRSGSRSRPMTCRLTGPHQRAADLRYGKKEAV